jgi:uncharacterized protein (TIGR03435 family)
MKGFIGVVLLTGALWAQVPDSAARFEAASVKRNVSGDTFADGGFQPGGRLTAINVTLANLVTAAYAIPPDRVEGGPTWARQDRFDVVAVANKNASVADTRLMLRNMLAERFVLVTRRRMRDAPIFAMTSTRRDRRPGPQLRPTKPECAAKRSSVESLPPEAGPTNPNDPSCGRVAFGGGLLSGRAVSVGQIAESLGGLVGRPVTDRSGLADLYDFELRFSRPSTKGEPLDPPEIFTAIREQLGLQLDADRGPVEVIEIVSAAPPTVD